MTILETVIPVFLMIFLGKFLKSKNIISDSGISCIKSISTNVFLPVMAFDTLIHGSFSLDSLLLIGLEIFILFTAFGLGFLFKRFFDPSINGYVPYAMTTYEGGLFGWALIAILVGHKSEAMFSIVSMDIFSGIFCFTVCPAAIPFDYSILNLILNWIFLNICVRKTSSICSCICPSAFSTPWPGGRTAGEGPCWPGCFSSSASSFCSPSSAEPLILTTWCWTRSARAFPPRCFSCAGGFTGN